MQFNMRQHTIRHDNCNLIQLFEALISQGEHIWGADKTNTII